LKNGMKKKNIYNYLILLMVLPCVISAQDLEKNLLSWLQKHGKQELKARLATIRQKYPNSPVPLFLEAYTEEDGDRAFQLYRQIIKKYPDSKFTDDALLKVAQYYYALGSYVSARQYLDNLADQFPDSPLVPEAKYLAARCLIATGYYISAGEELRKIIKNYPDSPFKKQAREELALLNALSHNKDQPSRFYGSLANSGDHNGVNQNQVKYTIQIGAFRDKKNARRLQKYYSKQGYLVTIDSKPVSGSLLYLVRVGEFETEQQAASFGEVFKNLHGVSFHVVRK